MRHGKIVFIFLILLGLMTACEKASETLVEVPTVSIDCSSTESDRCSSANNGKTVFVVMTRSGCANANFEPVATSSKTLSCTGAGCSASLSNWLDQNQNDVDQIITGFMSLCAYVDVNNNLQQDSGDVEHTSEMNIQSSSAITLDTWRNL